MKISGYGRRHCSKKNITIVYLFVLLFFVLSSSTVLGASGEGQGPKDWIATDSFRVMNFVGLAVALFLVLRKPLSQALSSRIRGIKEQLQELEVRKAEAERQLIEYSEKLTQLEKEAEKIVEDYIQQGIEAKARILQEAESSAEKLKAHARRNIDHEFEQAKSKLQEEIFETSLVKAEEIIKSRISAEDQDRIVDEYLKKVVAG